MSHEPDASVLVTSIIMARAEEVISSREFLLNLDGVLDFANKLASTDAEPHEEVTVRLDVLLSYAAARSLSGAILEFGVVLPAIQEALDPGPAPIPAGSVAT